MDDSANERCCVCGAKATSRCSACAKHKTSLFFCSQEHQKLVWKNGHSLVCGAKSNPFRFAPFSADETMQAVTSINKPVPMHDVPPEYACTIAACMVDATGLEGPRMYEETVKVLQHPELLPVAKQHSTIETARTYLWLLAVNSLTTILPHHFHTIPLWQHIAHFNMMHFATLPSNVVAAMPPTDPRWSPFYHAVLITFTLLRHVTSPEPPVPRADLERYCIYACDRLLKLCVPFYQFPSGEKARREFNTLAPFIISAFPMDMYFTLAGQSGRVLEVRVVAGEPGKGSRIGGEVV
ncbi:hypothetical protein JCM6882_007570 [Rhodosporidiobolus microsporus]